MTIVGMFLVRNEQWVLGCSLEAALRWCDRVIVADHMSEDGTSAIIERVSDAHPNRVSTYFIPETKLWDEMDMRQDLLEQARELGGTHFAMIDADEVLTANYIWEVRRWIKELAPGQVLDVPMIPVWGDMEHYRTDTCVWTSAWLSIAFCDKPNLTWKPAKDGYQHHHRCPYGVLGSVKRGHRTEGGGMHLQFGNPRRLLAKHIAYRMNDLLRWPERETPQQLNKKYDMALDNSNIQLSRIPKAWWDGYSTEQIDINDIPYQEGQIANMIQRYGREEFKGLDLHGF